MITFFCGKLRDKIAHEFDIRGTAVKLYLNSDHNYSNTLHA